MARHPFPDAKAETVLRTMRPTSLVQVQCWPGSVAQARRALGDITGVKPGGAGQAVGDATTVVMTLAEGRWLVQSSTDDLFGTMSAKLPAKHATATDLGHARTVFALEGGAARHILNTGLPVDLDPSVFAPGCVAQSLMHHIDVTVRCVAADLFEVSCMTSFGQALREMLCDAGEPHGLRITGL